MVEMASLEEDLCSVAGHLNAQHARLVDLTIQLLADPQAWSGDGVWRADQYLTWRVGLSPARARQVVAIAERADELPVSMDAFRRGELSIDQMTPIAHKAPWWTDDEICSLGQRMTVQQLRKVLAKYPFPDIANPNDVEPADDSTDDSTDDEVSNDAALESPVASETCCEAEPRDRWVAYFDDSGRYHLSVDTDHATGKILDTALTEARDTLFHHGHPHATGPDALREVCERSLDAIEAAGRRDRFRINMHLDIHGAMIDATGTHIPDEVRKHLTCDGLWTPTFTNNGFPISVGRTQRIVPDRTRRHVILRDGGCRVPGCTQTHIVEIHHIIHWDNNGPTDTWNLVALCPHHHRLHHHGRLGITGNADNPNGLTFTNQVGNPIAQTGAKPKPPEAPPPKPIGTYQHPLGERLDGRFLYFNPPPQHQQPATATPLPDDHWGRRSPLT